MFMPTALWRTQPQIFPKLGQNTFRLPDRWKENSWEEVISRGVCIKIQPMWKDWLILKTQRNQQLRKRMVSWPHHHQEIFPHSVAPASCHGSFHFDAVTSQCQRDDDKRNRMRWFRIDRHCGLVPALLTGQATDVLRILQFHTYLNYIQKKSGSRSGETFTH